MDSLTNSNVDQESKEPCGTCSWISNLFVHQPSSSSNVEDEGHVTRGVLFGLCVLYSFSIGSTIGVVPSVMMTRYAQQHHGLSIEKHCGATASTLCTLGSADAQTAAAMASFVNNALTFFTSSLIGSLSDIYGRKPFILGGIALSLIHPVILVWMQIDQYMSADWYYLFSSITGLVSWFTIALSSISDVTPKQHRAASFGKLIAAFSIGFAISPTMALTMTHYQVSIASLLLVFSCFILTLFYLPETLSPHISHQRKQLDYATQQQIITTLASTTATTNNCNIIILRPIQALSILNRNLFLRTVALLAFFSGMSSSGDRTLLLYYVEDYLQFNDANVALLFAIMGFGGIFVLGCALKPLVTIMGEKNILILSFLVGGFLHNTLYALATTKLEIFIGIAFSVLTELSFPTLSAMKSNHVQEYEQGQIQGALYSVSSLASALGPAILRIAYQYTSHQIPQHVGYFFLLGSFFFLIATILCAIYLSPEMANSKPNTIPDNNNNNNNSVSKQTSNHSDEEQLLLLLQQPTTTKDSKELQNDPQTTNTPQCSNFFYNSTTAQTV